MRTLAFFLVVNNGVHFRIDASQRDVKPFQRVQKEDEN